MLKEINLRNAHIALLVFVVVMVAGTVAFGGRNAGAVEEQIIVWGSLAAAFATLFRLEYRQGRVGPKR